MINGAEFESDMKHYAYMCYNLQQRIQCNPTEEGKIYADYTPTLKDTEVVFDREIIEVNK